METRLTRASLAFWALFGIGITVCPTFGADNLVCGEPYGLRNGEPISSAIAIVDPGQAKDLCADAPKGSEVVQLRCTTRLDTQHGSFYRCELGKDCINKGVFSSPTRKGDKICIHYSNSGSVKHHAGFSMALK